MPNAKAKLYYTTSKYLTTLPIENGNIIFVPDVNMVCLDMGNQRFSYQTIKTFAMDADRLALPFPKEGFYYVEETDTIWRWSGGWKRVSSAGASPILYAVSESEFPEEGEANKLYYTDNGIFNWNPLQQKYNLIANANRWQGI